MLCAILSARARRCPDPELPEGGGRDADGTLRNRVTRKQQRGGTPDPDSRVREDIMKKGRDAEI